MALALFAEGTYYLIGNTEELGAWNLDNALPMSTNNDLTLNLPSGTYSFKVLPQNSTWDGAMGYNMLNTSCSSENIISDVDDNIVVTLAETGALSVSVADGLVCVTGGFSYTSEYVNLTTSVTPEGAGYVYPSSGSYQRGSSVALEATISTGGWMFDRWSDNGSWDNPRSVYLTQDTTITAIFTPGEYGILVNGNRLVRGAFTERLNGSYIAQFLASVTLSAGDRIQIINLFHGDNSTWRPELEEGGLSANFSTGDAELICNEAGCYDIYMKIAYGQSSDYVYIGGGTNCSEGELLCSTASGTCGADGENLTWVFNCDNSVLTISGTGAMADYSGSSSVPWHDYQAAIRTAIISEGVTSLSSSAFEECTALESITLPEGLTTVGMYAFGNCPSLKGVDFPSTLTSLGSYCFGECWAVDSIACRATTPPTANGSTFSGVNYMIPVYVPAGTVELYQSADGWSGFTDFREIPCDMPIASGTCGVTDNLTWEISCDSIFTITGTGAMKDGDDDKWFSQRMAIKKVVIGDGITNLVSYAFREAENIREVIIGEGVTKIGNSAFWGCSGIRNVQFPSTLDTLEDQAFRSCAYLKAIDLPASVKYIGTWAFAYCYIDIDSIVCRAKIPPTCGNEAFYEIRTSTPLHVPARSVELYRTADVWNSFTNILALPDCIIASGECGAQGDNLTWQLECDSILTISGTGEMADLSDGQLWFDVRDKIKTIVINEGVTSIGTNAFLDCTNLTKVTCLALTPPTISSNPFSRQDTLCVPCEAKEAYKTAQNWMNFKRIKCENDLDMSFALNHAWTFIMLPTSFSMSAGDIVTDGDVQWATYNGETRAFGRSGWENYSAEALHSCRQALIARAMGETATLHIAVPDQATAMAETSVPLVPHAAAMPQNANWCFVGNPYPYGYLLSGLAAQGIESPIHVWNGTGYDTYTPGIDDYIIPAFGAFFIQLPEGTTETTSITFSAMYIYM